MSYPLPTIEQFEIMCRSHDWYYAYSDDHGVWKQGCAEHLHLQNIIEEGGEEYAEKYNEIYQMRNSL